MGSGVVNLYLQTQTKADSGVGEREGVHRVGASGLDMAPVVYATTPPTEPPPPQIQTQQKRGSEGDRRVYGGLGGVALAA
jgi:hypothetical protein